MQALVMRATFAFLHSRISNNVLVVSPDLKNRSLRTQFFRTNIVSAAKAEGMVVSLADMLVRSSVSIFKITASTSSR